MDYFFNGKITHTSCAYDVRFAALDLDEIPQSVQDVS